MDAVEEIRKRALTYVYGAGELLGNVGRNVVAKISPSHDVYRPDLSLNGKVCLITGGNSGIGFETAHEMTKRGCHVILACRNMEKANSAAEELRGRQPQSTIEVAEVRLSSLDSVRSFCTEFNARKLPLDFLILNAGIMGTDAIRRTTPDGFEEHFQINHLAHWLMAHRLVGEQRRRRRKIEGAAPPGKEQGVSQSTRVVFLTSSVHTGGVVDLHDLQLQEGHYTGFRGYAASKLENILAAKRMHTILPRSPSADAAVAVHPGLVQTSLAKGWLVGSDVAMGVVHPLTSAVLGTLAPILLASVSNAARSVVYASLAPSSEIGGQYVAYGKVATSSKRSCDEELAAGLWEASMKLTGEEPWGEI